MLGFGKKKKVWSASGYKGLKPEEMLDLGYQPLELHPLRFMGQRWINARRVCPKLMYWIMGCFSITFLSLLISMYSILSRPDPLLFVSFPDGSVVCSGFTINPRTHQINPRPVEQQQLCHHLGERHALPDNGDLGKSFSPSPAQSSPAQSSSH